jgi:hypothetical protein
MLVTLAGQRWTIRWVNWLGHRSRRRGRNLGDCDWDARVIRIVRKVDGHGPRCELDTYIHEALHAIFPWMPEWIVEKAATEMARMLWKLGYRRVSERSP